MKRRKRRNTSEPKKPISMKAYTLAGIAIVSMAICFGTLLWSYSVAGNTPKAAGGISMVTFLVTVVCFFQGVGVFRDQTYSRRSRLTGLIFTSIAFVIWISIYIAGLVIG